MFHPFKRTIGQNKEIAQAPIKPEETGDPGDLHRETMQTINKVLEEMGQIRGQISTIESRQNSATTPPVPAVPEQKVSTLPKQLHEYETEELDEMTTQQTAKIMQDGIIANVGQTISEAITPLVKRLDTLQQETTGTRVQTEIQKVENEVDPQGNILRPDFKDWLPEMTAKQKETPGLSIEELYILVKNRAAINSPTKFEDVKKKYWPVAETKENILAPAFGGIAPNLMNSTIDGGDSSLDDAGEIALKKVREEYGAIPPPDQALSV